MPKMHMQRAGCDAVRDEMVQRVKGAPSAGTNNKLVEFGRMCPQRRRDGFNSLDGHKTDDKGNSIAPTQ